MGDGVHEAFISLEEAGQWDELLDSLQHIQINEQQDMVKWNGAWRSQGCIPLGLCTDSFYTEEW